MFDFFGELFRSDFMPHGHCYRWQPEILWLHVVSDSLITLAYYAIPFVLLYFVSRRRDLAFRWVFVLFGLFILLCGTTHLLEIWSVWHGTYRLTGSVKFITALVSIGTAVVLVPLVPEALRLPSPAHLKTTNAALQREIEEREHAQEELDSFFNLSPDLFCIADTKGRFTRVNPAFERVLGYTADDLIGEVVSDFVVEDDYEAAQAHYQILLRGESFRDFEVRLRAKDGAVHWFAWSSQPGPDGRFHGVGHEITRRKEAEDALQETVDRLRAFAEALPGLAFLIDEDGRYVEVFATQELLLYDSPAALKGRLLAEVLPPDDAARFHTIVRQVIETGEAVQLEYPLEVQGGLRWFEGRGAPMPPMPGAKPMIVWIVHDVTERKAAESALRASLTRTQALYELSRSGLLDLSHDDVLQLYVDKVAEVLPADRVALFQLDFESRQIIKAIAGGPGAGQVAEVGFDELSEGLTGWVMEHRQPVLSPYGTPDPRESEAVQQRRVETACGDVIVAPLGTAERFVGTLTAINRPDEPRFTEKEVALLTAVANQAALAIENTRLLASLREKEARTAEMLRTTLDGYLLMDDSGKILDANPAYAEVVGYPRAEIIGKNIQEIAALPEAEVERRIRLATESAQVRFESVHRHRDGHDVLLDASLSVLDMGEAKLLTAFVRDITERKRVEAERERLVAELEAKNAELERFTYTVSHDLKAPLVTIQGFVGLLEKDARRGDADRIDEDIAYIRDAVETMRQLLDELLELSRIGRLVNAPEPVAFTALAHDALARLGGAIEQTGAEVIIPDDLPVVYGDRTRLLEVLQNLIANAIKFSGPEPAPRVDVGVRSDGAETVFFVRDYGAGIDPRYHDRIFGLFERLDHSIEGTGIGLALVRRIVEVHGGRIWVESEGAGAGSTFCFTLPLYQPVETP